MYWVIQNDLYHEPPPYVRADKVRMMHWILQSNLYHEEGMVELLATLERYSIPHSQHKVVPFVGELEPDIDVSGSVICFGSYAMRHIAKKKGWSPGVFDLEGVDFDVQYNHWGTLMLNADARVMRFADVSLPVGECRFIRPVEDLKTFAGALFDAEEFQAWQHKVVNLKEDDGSTLTADTKVLVAYPKQIQREFRFWVVNGRVVTGCQYKAGSRVLYDTLVETGAEWLASWIADTSGFALNGGWQPAKAYVLDIARIGYDYKIVEINTINAAGLYKANVPKLVEALENFGGRSK